MVSVIVINVFISFLPGISKEAHFGGGIIGAVVGLMLNQHRFGRDPIRWIWIGAVALVPVLCVGALIRAKDSDPKWQKGANQARQEDRGQSGSDEIDDFNKNYIKDVLATRHEVDLAVGRAEEARTRAAADRQPKAQRDEALRIVEGARRRVDATTRRVENAGPYESQVMRDTVREILDALRHDKSVLDLCEQSLTGEWGAADDDKLERALDNRRTAWRKFEARLKRE
jgi:hypothetical protein